MKLTDMQMQIADAIKTLKQTSVKRVETDDLKAYWVGLIIRIDIVGRDLEI